MAILCVLLPGAWLGFSGEEDPTLDGRVWNLAGEPVANAEVALRRHGPAWPSQSVTHQVLARSKHDGSFQVALKHINPLDLMAGAIVAEKEGTVPWVVADEQVIRDFGALGLSLVVAESRSVSGVVIDRNGEPASGLSVKLTKWEHDTRHIYDETPFARWKSARTDENGAFTIKGVPRVPLFLWVGANKYQYKLWKGSLTADEDHVSVVVAALPAPGAGPLVLRGVIRRPAGDLSTTPTPDGWIEVRPWMVHEHFRFDDQLHRVEFSFEPTRSRVESERPSIEIRTPGYETILLPVEPVDGVLEFDVTLRRDGTGPTGLIVKVENERGQASIDACVCVSGVEPQTRWPDEHGVYRFTSVPPEGGLVGVIARSGDILAFARLDPGVRELSIPLGSGMQHTARPRLRLIDELGEPFQGGAQFSVDANPWFPRAAGKAIGDGLFQFPVSLDYETLARVNEASLESIRLRLEAYAREPYCRYCGRSFSLAEVLAPVEPAEIRLVRAGGITLRVTDERGFPLHEVTASIVNGNELVDRVGCRERPYGPRRTYYDGVARFRELPQGPVRLRLEHESREGHKLVEVDVDEAGMKPVNVTW